MQTAMNPVNPALAQVIGAMDRISPVTPEGTPTVAAQVMQAAGMAPPALPQIAQQAGLGGQIQAMQMQEAQKQLMEAAMRQQQMPQMQPQMPTPQGGLEALNPRVGNFAHGGIVGYAAAGMAEEDQSFVEPAEAGQMVAPAAEVAAPAQPEGGIAGLATSSAPAIAEMRRVAAEMAKMPVSADPRKAMEAGIVRRQVANEFARATGNDPEMVANQIKQMEDFYRRRDEQLERRYQEAAGRRGQESLAQYLMNFRQMKGRPIGEGFVSASQGLARFQGGLDAQMRDIEDLRMQLEGLKMEKVNSLKTLKYNTDMGYMNEAMKEQQRLIDNDRAQKKTEFELAKKVAELQSAEARTAQVESGRMTRAEEREETVRRGQDIRRRLGLESGAGKAPRIHKTKTDEEGFEVIYMSDGTRINTGVRSQEFNNRISNIVLKLRKDNLEFADLPIEEQRNIAAEVLTGRRQIPATPSSATPRPAPTAAPVQTPGASPTAAPRGTRENPIKLD